jgi:hypothetical protein
MHNTHRALQGVVMTNPGLQGDRREEPALAADPLSPTSGQPSRPSSVPPDPGCYEIGARLTGLGAYAVIFGLVLIAVGVFQTQSSLYERVSFTAVGGLVALREIIPIISRKILFRADPAGTTLGAPAWFGFSHSTVFIPWTDIKEIALYKITRRSKNFGPAGSYIVIVPRGAAQARARRTDTWRLDPERLTAIAATAAPSVPVVDAGDVDPWVDADMNRLRAVLGQLPE